MGENDENVREAEREFALVNSAGATDKLDDLFGDHHFAFERIKDLLTRALLAECDRRREVAQREMCDLGHRFVILKDHPRRNGLARCPHCLATGLDAARSTEGDRA